MTDDMMVGTGSVTKMVTAVAIMELHDQGRINVDDAVHLHVDRILREDNGTTLLELWNGDQTINTVTIRQLLHMSGGLRDYEDDQI